MVSRLFMVMIELIYTWYTCIYLLSSYQTIFTNYEFWVMIQGKRKRNNNLINKSSTSNITIKYVINRLLHIFCHIITRIRPKKTSTLHSMLGVVWVFFGLIRVMIWQKPCNTILGPIPSNNSLQTTHKLDLAKSTLYINCTQSW